MSSSPDGRRVLNLTPHTITIYLDDEVVEIEPDGRVVRLEEEDVSVPPTEVRVGGRKILIPTIKRNYSLNLKSLFELVPELSDENCVVIVSIPVFLLLSLVPTRERKKIKATVVTIDSSKGAVRDEKNRVIGTKGFIVLPSKLVLPS